MTEWQMYLWFGLQYTADRLNWFSVLDDQTSFYADDGFGNLCVIDPLLVFFEE